MRKVAYIQTGPENAGKTTSIRLLFDRLKSGYSPVIDYHLDNGCDLRAIVTIEKLKIGIESLGDPWKLKARLIPSLDLFVLKKCQVIVSACRTRGGTVDAVSRLEAHGYRIYWRRREREVSDKDQTRANRLEAEWMLEQIEKMM